MKEAEELYGEKLRPQIHFSARKGWLNDPNGLVYYAGEYHLFFQHNPAGCTHGNMHWGHAVSRDLVHWEELPAALAPDASGTVFSGSGVVDHQNTAGFQAGREKTLVCVYTAAGDTSEASRGKPFTQAIAYSCDRGRSWARYRGNPVVPNIVGRNRDPKVVWYEPGRRWIMALYLEEDRYGLLSSADLKTWTRLSGVRLPGSSECPDFFELPVEDGAGESRWVFWGADGRYLVGRFDGAEFRPDGEAQRFLHGGGSYAAQTWSDIPEADGRRIQISWMRLDFPDMPFNQCLTFPTELSLRRGAGGLHLVTNPVREIALLRRREHRWVGRRIVPGENPLKGAEGELFHIRAELGLPTAKRGPETGDTGLPGARGMTFGFTIRGIRVSYHVGRAELSCRGETAPLPPRHGVIHLELVVDRCSVEIFGNGGEVVMVVGFIPEENAGGIAVFTKGGPVEARSLEVHELRSIWESRRQGA